MRKLFLRFANSELYFSIVKSMLSRYLVYMVSILSLIILSRLFTPANFGVLGAVTVLYTFLHIFVEAGITPAIISLKSLPNEERNGLFTLTVITGFLSSVIVFSFSNLIEDFYNINGVAIAAKYIGIASFFFGCQVYVLATLARDKKFLEIGFSGALAELIGLISTVLLSFFVPPLHALCSKSVIVPLVNFTLLYAYSKSTEFGQPKFGLNFNSIKTIFSFSIFQMSFSIVNFFSRNLDNILIGRFFGSVSLGIYDKAYAVMKYPLSLLTFSMVPAIQPVITKHRENTDLVEKIHTNFVYRLMIAGILSGIIVFFSADLIVNILLGDKWRDVALILKIFSLCIPIQIVLSTIGSFFQALCRTDILLVSGVLSAIVMTFGIVWGLIVQNNIESLAFNIVVAYHINFIQAYVILYKVCFKQGLLNFIKKNILVFLMQLFFLNYGIFYLSIN